MRLLCTLLLAAACAAVAAPSAQADRTFTIAVRVPGGAGVAGIETLVLVDRRAATVLGTAPVDPRASTLGPIRSRQGTWIGVYASSVRRRAGLFARIVVRARRHGRIEVRLARTTLVDRNGRRLTVQLVHASRTLRNGRGRRWPAPASHRYRTAATRGAVHPDVTGDGLTTAADVEVAAIAWTAAHGRTPQWRARIDVDGDGATTVADVQAIAARVGPPAAAPMPPSTGQTGLFVVDSAADDPDAAPGDGVCRTSAGGCTLRAAIDEANRRVGPDTIRFAIPSPAGQPTIQLASSLPAITDEGLTIAGDSQSGAVSTTDPATFDGRPGVQVRGNGIAAGETGLALVSAHATIRGLRIESTWRAVWMRGPASHDNAISGSVIGSAEIGVLIDGGAWANRVGIATPAGRMVIGDVGTGVDLYGTATRRNVVQNLLIGLAPDGRTPWPVAGNGVDHNFGPSDNLIGGGGPLEGNVIAATGLTGIEVSHGWNPALPPRQDASASYQLRGNQIVGNRIGVAVDGSTSSELMAGGCLRTTCGGFDNGNGINVIDGAVATVVRGNTVVAHRNAIFLSGSNTLDSVVRENRLTSDRASGVEVELGASRALIADNAIVRAVLAAIDVSSPASTAVTLARNEQGSLDRAIVLAPGANAGVSAPTIGTATSAAVAGSACSGCTVEVFLRRGERFLGAAITRPDGRFAFSLPEGAVTAGDGLSATATDAAGGTSELGPSTVATIAPATIASDGFERVGAGFGPGWSLSGPGISFSVDGQGRVVQAADGVTRSALIAGVTSRSASLLATLSIDRPAAGGPQFAYLVLRSTPAGEARANLRLQSDGRAFVTLTRVVGGVETDLAPAVEITAIAGRGPLRVRFEAVGSAPLQLRVRAWTRGTPEPSAWLAGASDESASLEAEGAAGLRSYLSPASTAGPVRFSWDDVELHSLEGLL